MKRYREFCFFRVIKCVVLIIDKAINLVVFDARFFTQGPQRHHRCFFGVNFFCHGAI